MSTSTIPPKKVCRSQTLSVANTGQSTIFLNSNSTIEAVIRQFGVYRCKNRTKSVTNI